MTNYVPKLLHINCHHCLVFPKYILNLITVCMRPIFNTKSLGKLCSSGFQCVSYIINTSTSSVQNKHSPPALFNESTENEYVNLSFWCVALPVFLLICTYLLQESSNSLYPVISLKWLGWFLWWFISTFSVLYMF